MIVLGAARLTSADFESIIFQKEKIEISFSAIERVERNFEFLLAYAQNKIIYGINTGLGPMAQHRIDEADQKQLQLNLIRSHSAGSGDLFEPELAQATLVARLNSLLQGKSGIPAEVVQLLAKWINQNIYPSIYKHGGVGASGDLVQLAHLALNLIGEGKVFYDGKLSDSNAVLQQLGIQPLQIRLREGLALMNGTSAMTGIGMVNIIEAKKMIDLSIALSSMCNELMKSFDDHFSVELNQSKLHSGQQKVAAVMREFLHDSKLIRKRYDHLHHAKIEQAVFTDKVQEYYSLRCVPQIVGPVLDTLLNVEKIVVNELNSVNDNPIIDHEKENVYHGGNFHGDYVSWAMDQLKIVITKLTMLAERQLNYLLNDRLNQKLPPFINLGKLGLNFGLQGMQFTATSTTAESQTLSYPMYLHSISSNNDNQDLVSMGCNSALMTRTVIKNASEVLTIHAIAIAQAIDYLKCEARLSSKSLAFYNQVRAIVPAIVEDKVPAEPIEKLRQHFFSNPPLTIFSE